MCLKRKYPRAAFFVLELSPKIASFCLDSLIQGELKTKSKYIIRAYEEFAVISNDLNVPTKSAGVHSFKKVN